MRRSMVTLTPGTSSETSSCSLRESGRHIAHGEDSGRGQAENMYALTSSGSSELTTVRWSVGVADQRLLASHELGHCRLFRESLRRRTLTLAPSQAGIFHCIPRATIDRTRDPSPRGEEPRAR